jgi:hypothetical protein
MNSNRWLLAVMLLPLIQATVSAQNEPRMWTTTVQTGMTDTFQLFNGGTFGNGPNWQNRVTTGIGNLVAKGDALSVYGWDTLDVRTNRYNWQAGLGYKRPVWKRGGRTITLGSGVQRWLFPSVKCGTNDWLIPGNLAYQDAFSKRTTLLMTSDSLTLLKSTLPTGTLLHSQAWLQTKLIKRESVEVTFRHGPAHTYSWNFYGANGNRVFRYQTMLAISHGPYTLEGGYRKQWALQPGIPQNGYWQFTISRTMSSRLSD